MELYLQKRKIQIKPHSVVGKRLMHPVFLSKLDLIKIALFGSYLYEDAYYYKVDEYHWYIIPKNEPTEYYAEPKEE